MVLYDTCGHAARYQWIHWHKCTQTARQGVYRINNWKRSGSVTLGTTGAIKMVMAKESLSRKNNRSTPKTVSRKEMTHIVAVRLMIMAAIDLVGIATLLSVRSEAIVELAFVNYWLLPLAIVFGVLTACAVAYQVLVIVKKIDITRHYFTPAMMLCVSLFCLIACLVYKHVIVGTLIIASVVATILFGVYCLYVHVFYR